MSLRLSAAEAEALVVTRLGDTPRAAHSRFVGAVLERLGSELGADIALWRVVGLVHDLDYFAVDGDWSQHGRVTAEWLTGRLPPEALEAIAAHDHRSGITSATALAAMLKLADALAVLDESAGREPTRDALRSNTLAQACGERTYLAGMIEELARQHGLALDRLAGMLGDLPRQA